MVRSASSRVSNQKATDEAASTRRGRPIWFPRHLVSFAGKSGEPAQSFGHLHAAADAGDHHVDHGEGRVEVAARLELLDRHACRSQCFGVGDTLVTQRIELTGHHESRGQARELAAERRNARVGAIGGRAVDVPEPVHQRPRQEIARRIFVVGRTIEGAVGDRAYQKLARDLRAAAVARQLAGDGCDVAAGAPARDQNRSRHAAELGRVLGDPARRRIAVFCRGREAVFGRMTIPDTDEDHPGTPAHVAAERIVGLLVTQHPAAAMEIDHNRMWPRRCRPIETIGQTDHRRRAVCCRRPRRPAGRLAGRR